MISIDYHQFEEFMNTYHKDDLVDTNPNIIIDYHLLDMYCNSIAEELEDNYRTIIMNLERFIKHIRIQHTNTRIRIKNVPPTTSIHNLHQEYNGKWISFEGIIKKRSKVFNRIKKVHWTCNNCGQDNIYKVGYDETLTPPKTPCTACSRKNGYTLNRKESQYQDLQLIIIEEKQEETKSIFQPAQIKCYLKDKMVNTANPGDKVRVNGILELKNNKKENIFTEFINITHIENQEENYEHIKIPPEEIRQIKELSQDKNIYEKIIKSIIPSLYGHNELKLAIALHLFSSPNHYTHDGMYKRGDIHILLIGDPSVGKSQILKYVTKLAPRGIYTSGKSASGSGLTATVVKDEIGGWSLEAGAMVLANNGNICIDEFDKMKEEDRSAIHEALEQQTVSISKAGINTTLNTRCSVIAAANPKYGRFNKYKELKEQLTLTPTILSRFDLIFLITDEIDKQQDKKIAIQILKEKTDTGDSIIKAELLKKYISLARQTEPLLSDSLIDYISNFFSNWRNLAKENNHPLPITARQLEAIARLSKASARIRLSDEVTIDDVKRAIELEKYCMKHAGFDTQTQCIEADKVLEVSSQKEQKEMIHMMEEFKKLSDQWANNVPRHVLFNHMQLVGYSKNKIRKWIKENLDIYIKDNEADDTYSRME